MELGECSNVGSTAEVKLRCSAANILGGQSLALPMRPNATSSPPSPNKPPHVAPAILDTPPDHRLACSYLGLYTEFDAHYISRTPLSPPPERRPLSVPPLPAWNTLTMAANGVQQVFDPVMAAHSTMQSGASREQKEQAHQFLEQFQKSVGWA